MLINFEKVSKEIKETVVEKTYGVITSVNGYRIVSHGPNLSIGDLCSIESDNKEILCEVIGFNGNEKTLMPFDTVENVKDGDKVYKLNKNLSLNISEDYLGCVLNGIGEIIQDNGIKDKKKVVISMFNNAPKPTERGKIDKIFNTGVNAIDGLLTLGVGQRVGIFAGSGVGKSTLLGNIIKNSTADVKVICLLGERGRELNEFMEILGDSINESIIVTATSNESALLRLKSAYSATSIAEYFRDQGKDVLLVMDSLTRFAMAQRDIASNIGEIGVNKGYPPSVFSMLPELLERAGKNSKGSITGIYTVLVEGDDENEIISDTVRGILDGHIILSRKLANKKHFPAIDALKSVSRIMNDLIDDEHKEALKNINGILEFCETKEDYLSLMYQAGSDKNIDRILELDRIIAKFATQSNQGDYTFEAIRNFIVSNFSKVNVRL